MGTRNLTCAVIGGEYKIAQYGQWDGYPEGQGADALAFLKGMNRSKFEAKLKATRWLTDADAAVINATPNWPEVYPHCSRDAGAKILQMVADAPAGIALQNQLAFAGDSLFCEWAYVVDFDKNTFEVYKGFNQTPLDPAERFAHPPPGVVLEKEGAYEPVTHVKTYALDALPCQSVFIDEVMRAAYPENYNADGSSKEN